MICTFCGTENPPSNRFCGMCGVRMERRKAERRVRPSGNAKCPACNHVNEPGYKFCGMCGERVDRRIQERRGASGKSRATAVAGSDLRAAYPQASVPREQPVTTATRASVLEPERSYSKTIVREEPAVVASSVSGPSFLGLNDDEGEGQYLLEDEKRSGHGFRAIILVMILAAIAGLVFIQWKSSLRANPKPLEQPKPEPASVPAGRNHAPQLNTPAIVAGAHAVQAATASVAQKVVSTNAKDNVKDKDAGSTADTHEKLASNRVPAKPVKNVEDDPPEKTTDPPESNKPSAALLKAQKYIQGRGVPQNCEQGLMYLRAATEENDPRAAVQMGALYSSGLCVRQDRVTAYRWFSSARDMEPNNRWISKNLNQLWAQMTPSERRSIH